MVKQPKSSEPGGMRDGPGQCALRRGRWSEPGRVYHVTTTTRRRRPVFGDLRCARLLVEELRAADRAMCTRTLAFVIMPDHLHWLFELAEGHTLVSVVSRVKGRSSRVIGKLGGMRGVWQEGFFDRALRRDEDARAVSRYIVANPLRAGLVADIAAYPHWDAVWLTGEM